MKKLLLACLYMSGVQAFAQENHDQITEVVVARNKATNTTMVGQMLFFKQQWGKKSAISGILFGEQDNHGNVDIMCAAGPARSTEHITLGVMVGGSVATTVLSPCAALWAYAQSKNGKGSFFTVVAMQKEGVTLMIEGLYCVYTWKEFEVAFGGINLREYLGPYLRVSSGSMYIGVNLAFKCLPNMSSGHTEGTSLNADAKVPHSTGENTGHYVQIVVGKEIFASKKGNRCKDCE